MPTDIADQSITLTEWTQNADGNYYGLDKTGGVSTPADPTGAAVTRLSDTSLRFSWIDNATNETGYEVDRSPNGSTGWVQLAVLGPNSVSYDNTGLEVDTTYYFRVRAINGGLASGYATANGTTTAPQSGGADYPLEIIQPRAGLDTSNRFYKQYPGIEYNVRPGVIGGVYPFTYALTQAPSGMTINFLTGEITWPNPVESGSPHTVTVRVMDSELTTQTVSWTVTVTTSGFKFVDSASGNDSNDGSISNPWQTLEKMADASGSDFIYFRAGTYATTQQNSWSNADDPAVWMAYPGETVNWDLANGGFFVQNADNRLYVDSLTLNSNNNSQQRAISYVGAQSNITFRRNTFTGLNNGVGGNNPSYLFSTNAGTQGEYTVIQDNIVSDGTNSSFVLGYANSKVLIEDNNVSNTTSSTAFTPKDGNQLWFVRGNTTDIEGISFQIQEFNSQGHGKGLVVVEYNNFRSTVSNCLSAAMYAQDDEVIFRRNTIRGRTYIRPTSSTDPLCTFENNVIINEDSGSTDRVRTGPEGDQGRIVLIDNLSGGSADGIVDSNGLLTGASRTTYLGTRGHEIV